MYILAVDSECSEDLFKTSHGTVFFNNLICTFSFSKESVILLFRGADRDRKTFLYEAVN